MMICTHMILDYPHACANSSPCYFVIKCKIQHMRMLPVLISALSLLAGLNHARAGNADTAFQKTNPNLLYTTKDFYIELPANCYGDAICVQDFFLIMTFDVGIDGTNTIRQAQYKNAEMECSAKTAAGTTYKKYDFKESKTTITDNGYGVVVEFLPVTTTGWQPYLQKFTFSGKMQGESLTGMLSFHTPKGISEVALN